MADVANRGFMNRMGDRDGLTPVQENLARIFKDEPKFVLNLSEGGSSKVIAFLQKGLNELGQKNLMGVDYKPLDVTGQFSPEFAAAMQNYLADKRTHEKDTFIPSYSELPEVKSAKDIGVLHLSAMMDSLQDNGILQKGQQSMQIELLEALREIKHSYLRISIDGIEQDLRKQGVPVSESTNDAVYAQGFGAPKSSPIKLG